MRVERVVGILLLVQAALPGGALDSGGDSQSPMSNHAVITPESRIGAFLRPGLLRSAAKIHLPISDNTNYDILINRAEHSGDGRTALYTGPLVGNVNGRAIFAVTGQTLSGILAEDLGRRFVIRNTRHGSTVEEIDEKNYPAPQEALVARVTEWHPAEARAPEDDLVFIDVMVLYTPAAATAAGGVAEIENLIELAAAEANLSYSDSGVRQQIRIVHKAVTEYEESGGSFLALLKLTGKADGVMDEVHDLRDQYGADIVSLWVNTADSCGLSWQMNDINRPFEQFAFSVVNQSCATGNMSFAHELGHLMGAQHNRESAGSPGVFPFSYGYRRPGPNGFRTIMSYGCGQGDLDCPRVPFWSSPTLQFNGVPIGEADRSFPDNQGTLNGTRYIVAAWRSSRNPEDALGF